MSIEILNEQLLTNNGLILQAVALDVLTSVLVMTGLVKSIGGSRVSNLARSEEGSRTLCVQLNPHGYRNTYRAKLSSLRSVFSVGQIISFNRR